MKKKAVNRLFNVFLNGKKIDTVCYATSGTLRESAEDVRRALIDHDGYDSGIQVRVKR